jgi:hypothetical protein
VAPHINRLLYIFRDVLQLADDDISNPWPSHSSTFESLGWYIDTNHAALDISWEYQYQDSVLTPSFSSMLLRS